MPAIPGPTDPEIPTCGQWCDATDLRCSTDENPIGPVDAAEAIAWSSLILFELTQQRWPGICSATIRPCSNRSATGLVIPVGWSQTSWPWPLPVGTWQGIGGRGSWGYCGCNRSRRCGCSHLSEIDLLNDVLSVEQVKVDGEVVSPGEYELQEGRFLVALPPRVWPCCQHLDRSDDDEGTWSVAITYGGAPPQPGRVSAAALSCEYLKSIGVIEGACRLPSTATSTIRQGVTTQRASVAELFPNGLTGISTVDLFVQAVVGGARRRQGRVIVPGLHRKATRQS